GEVRRDRPVRAVPADGLVVGKRAPGHRQRAVEVVDAAADTGPPGLSDRPVAVEGRAADGHGGAHHVWDAEVFDAAAETAGRRGAGDVVEEAAAEDVTRAPGIIHEPAAQSLAGPAGLVAAEGAVGHSHGHAGAFAVECAAVAIGDPDSLVVGKDTVG